jgi:hypothetical protein
LIWIHGGLYFIKWGAEGKWASNTFEYQTYHLSAVTGVAGAVVVTVMWFTSLGWFRR